MTCFRIVFLIVAFLVSLPLTAVADSPQLIVRLIMGDSLDFFGTPIEPAGDQNGDGYADFWVGQLGTRPYGTVHLFYGGNPMDSIPDFEFTGYISFVKNAGDMNLDGFLDLCVVYYDSPARAAFFYGGPLLDTIPELVIASPGNHIPFSGYRTQSILSGHDLDGDGMPDLVWGEFWDSSNLSYFYSSRPVLDSIPDLVFYGGDKFQYYNYGYNIVYFDNLAGKSYLAVSRWSEDYHYYGSSVLLYETGVEIDTTADLEIGYPREGFAATFAGILENLGDVNGDGFDDLAAGTSGSSEKWIYFGGPEFDTIPDVLIQPSFEWLKGISDVNYDSYADYLVCERSFSGRAWIYYGGPDVDGLVDQKLATQWESNGFGWDIGGLGDVNGDGIDDFAVMAILDDPPFRPGIVYVYAGYDGVPTAIEIEHDPTLPEDFTLEQNHPNPFNPGTTIEFDLPNRSDVTLTVFNVLGHEVVTLVNELLSVGSYKIEWDGKDKQGRTVSSGVYFYRLDAGNLTESRKMVLLK